MKIKQPDLQNSTFVTLKGDDAENLNIGRGGLFCNSDAVYGDCLYLLGVSFALPMSIKISPNKKNHDRVRAECKKSITAVAAIKNIL